MDNLTSKMCLFVKAFHHLYSKEKVFDDEYAYYLLGEDYNKIYRSLEDGKDFFLNGLKANIDDAVEEIINSKIGPSILIRSAYNKELLEKEIDKGLSQYIIFASGYDTYGIGNKSIKVYEIDYKSLLEDKEKRIEKAKLTSTSRHIKADLRDDWTKELERQGFNKGEVSFGSLLGISYYLTKNEFDSLLRKISSIMTKGSRIVFDYPSIDESEETKISKKLAEGALENMKATYSYKEITDILLKKDYIIDNCLDYKSAKRYSNHKINPPKGVIYISAIKI